MNEESAMSAADVDDVPTVPYFLVLLDPGPNRASEPQHRAAHIAFIVTLSLFPWHIEHVDIAAAENNVGAARVGIFWTDAFGHRICREG